MIHELPRSFQSYEFGAKPDYLWYPSQSTPGWFREPGKDRGYQEPYLHTPLSMTAEANTDRNGRSVQEHQNELKAGIAVLAQNPPAGLDNPALKQIFELDLLAGIAHREVESSTKIDMWREQHPCELAAIQRDPVSNWHYGEALTGHASPTGLLHILRNAPSLDSLDLQVLTTPYGYRGEHVPAMREQLKRAVEYHGGVYAEDAPILPSKIKIAPHYEVDDEGKRHFEAIMATIKREVGMINGESESASGPIMIMERRAVIIRVDPAGGFPQEIVWKLEAASPHNNYEAEAVQEIKELIAAAQENTYMVPNSIMTYAYRMKQPKPMEFEAPEDEARPPTSLECVLKAANLTLEQARKDLPMYYDDDES